MNIQKLVRKCPLLSLGLRTGLPIVPFPSTTLAFGSCQLCPASPSAEELHCCPMSTATPHGLPSSSPPPPPNVHKGVWGWPICDRSEVSSGLGKGASQSGTGGAGHTVGFLSNWKPGAQQNPVNCLSGTEPTMTARPRQAATFQCSDSLSHRSRVRPSNSQPPMEQVAVEPVLGKLQRTSQFYSF